MRAIVAALIAGLSLSLPLLAQEAGGPEKSVWSLENAYWRYVQAYDLAQYRTLWSENFLGWPLTSPEPARKEHITDWLTAHSAAGDSLTSYRLEPLAAQALGDDVTVTYRIHMTWRAKDGAETPAALRILHTWRRSGGSWQIISGMAAAPDAQGH